MTSCHQGPRPPANFTSMRKSVASSAASSRTDRHHAPSSGRAAACSEEAICLLRHCSSVMATSRSGELTGTRFEEAFAEGDEEPFCKGFGPEHILGHLGIFPYYLGPEGDGQPRPPASRGIAHRGTRGLSLRAGLGGEAERAVAVELAAQAARDLPRAERLADLLYEQSLARASGRSNTKCGASSR